MKKLWDKNISTDKLIEAYTIGKDRELDVLLAPYDVLGTIAHIRMLANIGLLAAEELKVLHAELVAIFDSIHKENFSIEQGVEDVHSQIELMLTRKLGNIGKKIHSGRSRNDQVLVDLKLFIRHQLYITAQQIAKTAQKLLALSEKHKDILMPGYTHMQVAMPSSFGLWFGAYAESLTDDLEFIKNAFHLVNRNPLGSAAGYGSSFPLNRELTTQLLGFEGMNVNSVYAQMGRGKAEKLVAFTLASVGGTLSKFAMDVCLFMNQNFSFIHFPDHLTTGSSIMPHKKNPDVFELIRAKGNKWQTLPNEIAMITANLPHGYHRDLQLLKENFIPVFEDINNTLEVLQVMLENIQINEKCINDNKYNFLFSVEEVNKQVQQGVPFRDAYKNVAKKIEENRFIPDNNIQHTHTGSIGNPGNELIKTRLQKIINHFEYSKIDKALKHLLTL